MTANCKDESVAFQLFGFMRNDNFPKKTNWFDIEIQKDLPEIFLRFSEARRNEIARRALSQAINYYRASNASRDVSIEMAIIAAHGGLEAIVNHILETRAGWSAKLLDERSIAFSDKMRAASAHFGLYGDILLHSPEISALALARDRMDVFGLISFIRNKLVHQDPKFIPTGRQLIETWSVTQWLLEVLIFGVIGYRGKIIDRRIYRGWRGQTCDIPLRS